MPEIQYPKNPNSDTAFVVQEDGTKNRALMTAPQDPSTLELPSNPNSTKGYVTVDGKKQRVILTADVSGGGSGESYLPLTGGTLTGDLEMSNSKVQLHNTSYTFSYWLDAYLSGHLRIGKSSSVATGDLFISTGSGGDKSIAFGESGGSVGSADAKLEYIYTQKLSNGSDIAVPTTGGKIAVQVSTLPTAASTNVGEIYQFVGATDSTYTNGYFYKCVSDGQDPATYSWEAVAVQASSGGLPDQTGQSGKFLTTDGTDASWSDKPLVNSTTDSSSGTGKSLYIQATQGLTINNGKTYAVLVGSANTNPGNYGTIIGIGATSVGNNVNNSVAVGRGQRTNANYAIQIGGSNLATNSDANTFKVSNENGNFEIMSADGTIPADRLTHAINKYSTMPTASASNEGWIVQFTGTTDSTYTHGHLYECVSDGADPATYSWTEVSMGGGGSSYTAGTGIDITSGVISVADPVLVNKITNDRGLSIGGGINGTNIIIGTTTVPTTADSYTDRIVISPNAYLSSASGYVSIGSSSGATDYGIAIGTSAQSISTSGGLAIGYRATASGGVALGYNALAQYPNTNSIAIGRYAVCGAKASIQLAVGSRSSAVTNPDTDTFKVANTNGNFELMNANGNLPADRLASTTGLADGNYRLRCTITNGVPTLSWVAE